MRELLDITLKVVNPCTGREEFLSVEELITLALAKKAVNGNTRAYVVLMDSAYDKPVRNP